VLVLRAFTVERTRLSFAEVQQSTGLPKTTTHRVLAELVRTGLLERQDGRYLLSRLVFELGMRASVERRLLEVATPFLEVLREQTRETVHLGVRDGAEVVYVVKIGGHSQAASPSRLGGRMPLHATSIGKVLLAHAPVDVRQEVLAGPLRRYTSRTIIEPGRLQQQLDAVVERGVAFEHEESAVGIVCVAAAVLRQADTTAVAAVSVTGPVSRFHPDKHAAAVKAAADGIAVALERRGASWRA
jgi:DNA-binding IclR family transcriptional regulator